MEVRCQNCGEKLVVPARKPTDTTLEVACHSCGVTMQVRVPAVRGARDAGREYDEPRPSEQTWKRIFEPLPRPLIYGAGILLAAALLSPFWVYWVQERYGKNRVILSDDTEDLKVPPISQSNSTAPVISAPDRPPTTLDQYHNVRLEANREDMQHRFNLRLQNTRGMEPEIYEATKGGDWDYLTANFYGGVLKEVHLIGYEQRVTPDFIQKDLIEQFGPPSEQSEINGPMPFASESGLDSIKIGVQGTGEGLARKVAGLAFHRSMVWTDALYRAEATIHYTSADAAQSRSTLTLHLSAAAWLKNRQPLTVTIPPPLPR